MEEQRLRREFINIYFTTIKHIETEISKPLIQFRLSFEQYQILNDLATHEVATLTDIVAKRHVTKPAIAGQLRVLRDLGYVTQASDNGDHRRRLLQLTPLGKRVEAQASALSKAEFDRWVAIMGEQKLLDLLTMLQTASELLLDTPAQTTK